MAALTSIAAGATLAGALANAASGDGGGSETNKQSFTRFRPQDLNAIGNVQQGLRGDTNSFIAGAQNAQQQFAPALADFQAGRLGARERGLLSQEAQRSRRMQSARQLGLASQFGAGSKLANILGAQGQLQSDLGLNQARSTLAQQQAGNLGTFQAGLQGLQNFRGSQVDARRSLLGTELDLGKALGVSNNASQTQKQLSLAQRLGSASQGFAGAGTLLGG